MKCPYCNREIEYSRENPYRPFCSKKCKMADLGAWFSEEYTVSSPLIPEDDYMTEPQNGQETGFIQ